MLGTSLDFANQLIAIFESCKLESVLSVGPLYFCLFRQGRQIKNGKINLGKCVSTIILYEIFWHAWIEKTSYFIRYETTANKLTKMLHDIFNGFSDNFSRTTLV